MPDLLTQLHRGLWQIFVQSEEWSELVPPGNRINFDSDENEEELGELIDDENEDKDADGDRIEANLVLRRFTDSLNSEGVTFGTYDPESDCQQLSVVDAVFALTLTCVGTGMAEANHLNMLTLNLLRRKGATLELPYVTRATTSAELSKETREDEEVTRLVSTIQIALRAEAQTNVIDPDSEE